MPKEWISGTSRTSYVGQRGAVVSELDLGSKGPWFDSCRRHGVSSLRKTFTTFSPLDPASWAPRPQTMKDIVSMIVLEAPNRLLVLLASQEVEDGLRVPLSLSGLKC